MPSPAAKTRQMLLLSVAIVTECQASPWEAEERGGQGPPPGKRQSGRASGSRDSADAPRTSEESARKKQIHSKATVSAGEAGSGLPYSSRSGPGIGQLVLEGSERTYLRRRVHTLPVTTILPSKCEGSHGQYGNEWVWLRSHKMCT